jgi:uncharacterized protein (TIGR02300 family)
MPAKDFGTKHVCAKCGTKFYDMKKPDPICPKCGTNQRNVAPRPAERKSRLAQAAKIIEPIDAPEASTEDEEVEADEDEEAEEEA